MYLVLTLLIVLTIYKNKSIFKKKKTYAIILEYMHFDRL